MKKLLLSLGAIASVAAPVAAVVACGSTTPDATLKATKDLNIKTINASNLSAADKTSAIELINNAKTMEELTKDMSEIAAEINKVAHTTTGSVTNTGTPTATNTVKTEQSTLTADVLAATTADLLDNLADVRINLGIRLSGQMGTTGWTFDTTTLTLTHTTKNGDQEQKTVFKVVPKAVVQKGTAVTSGYEVTAHVGSRTTHYYLKDFTLTDIQDAFETGSKAWPDVFNGFLASTATDKVAVADLVSAFDAAKTIENGLIAAGVSKDHAGFKSTATWEIKAVTSGSFEAPAWAGGSQIYTAA